MAGWTATVDEWERFSEAWEDCRSRHPSIKYFKHYEAKHPSGEFHKLTIADGNAKILALAKVISHYDVRGYIATVKHSILSSRPEQLRKLMGTRIYDWAFIAMVSTILEDFLNRGELSDKRSEE